MKVEILGVGVIHLLNLFKGWQSAGIWAEWGRGGVLSVWWCHGLLVSRRKLGFLGPSWGQGITCFWPPCYCPLPASWLAEGNPTRHRRFQATSSKTGSTGPNTMTLPKSDTIKLGMLGATFWVWGKSSLVWSQMHDRVLPKHKSITTDVPDVIILGPRLPVLPEVAWKFMMSLAVFQKKTGRLSPAR